MLPSTPDGYAVPPANSDGGDGSGGRKKPRRSAVDNELLNQAAYQPGAVDAAYAAVNEAGLEGPPTWHGEPVPEDVLIPELPDYLKPTEAQLPPERQTALADARTRLTETLRARREAALRTNDQEQSKPVKIKRKVDEMTDQEYRKLNPLQKAAVDFNTELVGAVRRDRKFADNYDPNSAQREAYSNAMKTVFPTADRGASEYAPETLALLNQIGYSDTEADLNDFLHLDAAVRARDLKNLELHASPEPAAVTRMRGGMGGGPAQMGNTYTNELVADRAGMDERLARGMQNAQTSLEKGNAILAKLGYDPLQAGREMQVGLLGGAPTTEATMPGYGNPDFQQAFNLIADPNADTNRVFLWLQDNLSDKQRSQFMDYAQSRLVTAIQNDESLGASPTGVPYLDPRQVAGLLQVPGVKNKPAKAAATTPATTTPATTTPATAPAAPPPTEPAPTGGGY